MDCCCRISPTEVQYSSGQGISKKGQEQMKIKYQNISERLLHKGSSRNRSVCHQSDNSAPSVFFFEKRPLQSGNRCISPKLDKSKGICISPFSLVDQILKKVQKEQANLLIAPAWQPQAWDPCLLQISIKNPILLPKWPNLLKNPAGEITY